MCLMTRPPLIRPAKHTLQVLLLLQQAKTRKVAEERAEKAKWSKVGKCASSMCLGCVGR